MQNWIKIEAVPNVVKRAVFSNRTAPALQNSGCRSSDTYWTGRGELKPQIESVEEKFHVIWDAPRELQLFAKIPNTEYVQTDVNNPDNPALQVRAGIWKSSFKYRNAIQFGPLPKIEAMPYAHKQCPECSDASGRSLIQVPLVVRFPFAKIGCERSA